VYAALQWTAQRQTQRPAELYRFDIRADGLPVRDGEALQPLPQRFPARLRPVKERRNPLALPQLFFRRWSVRFPGAAFHAWLVYHNWYIESRQFMKNTRSQNKVVSAETIAGMAERGKNVSRFFTKKGRMMGPIQRVNVDFTSQMLEELDQRAEELNVSRQAVIKTMLRQALDQHYLATGNAPAVRKAKAG